MVPKEFTTLLEMTLYKLVGDNLIPKAFVTNEFWRKLRTKFTNAGQYAKIVSRKKPRKTKAKIPPEINAGSVAGPSPKATPLPALESAPVTTPPRTQNTQPKPTRKKKKKKASTVFQIPRDYPSSEDFVVEDSPRSKRVAATNKSFFYFLRRNGVTEEMLGNKEYVISSVWSGVGGSRIATELRLSGISDYKPDKFTD